MCDKVFSLSVYWLRSRVSTSVFFAAISNLYAHNVPEAPRVRNTTPPTPPHTVNMAGKPIVIPSIVAPGLPQKNVLATKAAKTDFHTTSLGSLILSTPVARSLDNSIFELLAIMARAKSFSFVIMTFCGLIVVYVTKVMLG